MSDDTVDEEEWEEVEEDAKSESEVTYPTLPPQSPAQKKSPSVRTIQAFTKKAKGINQRESLDFKSIVASGLRRADDNPFSATDFNTTVNKSNPTTYTNKVMKSPCSASKPSPSTIRRVRRSDAHEVVKPFEETSKYLSHGLPAKKRRHNSEQQEDFDGAKENENPFQSSAKVPGAWETMVFNEDEGDKRGSKRVRTEESQEYTTGSPQKKPNAAREAASKAAKERKKGGILSMSRLNMLARPKGH